VRKLKNIFDKIYSRAKSGTACSYEMACFRWQRNSPPAPAKLEENPPLTPAPHLPRSEREEASACFNPLQFKFKKGTKVMYRAGPCGLQGRTFPLWERRSEFEKVHTVCPHIYPLLQMAASRR
jgi:hypothetical protein